MVLLAKYDLTFVSKPSNLQIPFIGDIAYAAGYLPIDRENDRKALKTILTAADYIKRDYCSMGIYPEGTRSKTGEMLPFHNGLFNMAKEADVPVVVMTLHGTPAIKDNFPKRSVVHLDIVETIPLEDVRALTPHDMGVRARDAMLNNLAKYEQPAAD